MTEQFTAIPEDVREKLLKYREEHGLSWPALGRRINISSSTLYKICSGDYNSKNIVQKVKLIINFLERERKQSKVKDVKIPFVETRNALLIESIADDNQSMGGFAVITGDSGVGKSCGLQRYAEINPSSMYLQCTPMIQPKILFKELLAMFGESSDKSLTNELFKKAVNILKDRKVQLIFDEAEQLPYTALEMIRMLRDQSKVPLILAGMPKLAKNIRGGSSQYKQIYSRVTWFYELSPVPTEDIKELWLQIYPESNGLYKKVDEICKGSARAVENLIIQTSRLMRINPEAELDEKLLVRAASQLML